MSITVGLSLLYACLLLLRFVPPQSPGQKNLERGQTISSWILLIRLDWKCIYLLDPCSSERLARMDRGINDGNMICALFVGLHTSNPFLRNSFSRLPAMVACSDLPDAGTPHPRQGLPE